MVDSGSGISVNTIGSDQISVSKLFGSTADSVLTIEISNDLAGTILSGQAQLIDLNLQGQALLIIFDLEGTGTNHHFDPQTQVIHVQREPVPQMRKPAALLNMPDSEGTAR